MMTDRAVPVRVPGGVEWVAVLRLLPMSGREKDAEILALRHQVRILQRQLSGQRVRFEPADRAYLAALLGTLPRGTLRRLQLLISPDTVMRWRRDLLKQRHAARSRPKRAGRPRTVASIRRLVQRLARENGTWGYRCIHDELALLGITLAASTVWEILAGSSIRYLIHDRDGKFCAAFDEVLADAGIHVVLTGVRMPRMNAVVERWVGTCRRELLDRILI
jgi:hypothetical protein